MTPTKTLREQIKEILLKLESAYDQWNIDDGWIIWWEWCSNELETLLEEARQEMKEKCVEKLKQREKILIKDHRNYDVKQVQYNIKAISSL